MRTPASLVDRAGDDLLADAAFPGDEYLCVGARGAENLLLYFAQDRARTDELNRFHIGIVILSLPACRGGDIYTRVRLTSQPLNVQGVRYSTVSN